MVWVEEAEVFARGSRPPSSYDAVFLAFLLSPFLVRLLCHFSSVHVYVSVSLSHYLYFLHAIVVCVLLLEPVLKRKEIQS